MAESNPRPKLMNALKAARHLRRFSNRDANERWSGPITTSSGLKVFVRPARSGDRAALERFFASLSEEDLYFRFLSGIRKIDEDRLEAMLRDTDDHSIDFLALDIETGEILAAAMLVARVSNSSAGTISRSSPAASAAFASMRAPVKVRYRAICGPAAATISCIASCG